jgi:predicted protein tyrosine phosphatase
MIATEAPGETDLVTATAEARELVAARGLGAHVEQAARLARAHFPNVTGLELCVIHHHDIPENHLVLNVVTSAPSQEVVDGYLEFVDEWTRAAPPKVHGLLTVTFVVR